MLAVDPVAVADDAVVQSVETVAVTMDLDGALLLLLLLLSRTLFANPPDRASDAVLVTLAVANPLSLLGLLDLLDLPVSELADARGLAGVGFYCLLDVRRTLGPLDMAAPNERCRRLGKGRRSALIAPAPPSRPT